MKTKSTLLLATLVAVGFGSLAFAGPDQQTMEMRQQAASQPASRAAADDSGTHYVANPSGKGGTVVRSDSGASTSIALFKSSKKKSCDQGSCCAKPSGHSH